MTDAEPPVACLRPDSFLCWHPADAHHRDVLGTWQCVKCGEELDEELTFLSHHHFRPVIVTPGGFLPYPAV